MIRTNHLDPKNPPPKPEEKPTVKDGLTVADEGDIEDAIAAEVRKAGLPPPCRGCGR